jgi:hypothetical protein
MTTKTNGKVKDGLATAIDTILAELEVTAAGLGIKSGKGWQRRAQRESEHLPGPEAATPDEMERWFTFLPQALQMRARCLEQLMWLLTQIDERPRPWEEGESLEAFAEFDRSLAKMRRAREGLRRQAGPARRAA